MSPLRVQMGDGDACFSRRRAFCTIAQAPAVAVIQAAGSAEAAPGSPHVKSSSPSGLQKAGHPRARQ